MIKFFKVSALVMIPVMLIALCSPVLLRTIYPLKYEAAIEKCSDKFNLDKYLVMGVISAESRFEENAVSHKDAKGLMQIKDDTARWCAERFGISGDATEGEVNIEIGCAYIRYLLDIFGGNTTNALAAYNAGQGTVKRWLGDKNVSSDGKTLSAIPYGETREYIRRVNSRRKIYESIYGR